MSGREREIEAHTEIEKSSPDRLAERLDSIESREEVVDGIPHSQSEGCGGVAVFVKKEEGVWR